MTDSENNIGEQGPELVRLPSGVRVLANKDIRPEMPVGLFLWSLFLGTVIGVTLSVTSHWFGLW